MGVMVRERATPGHPCCKVLPADSVANVWHASRNALVRRTFLLPLFPAQPPDHNGCKAFVELSVTRFDENAQRVIATYDGGFIALSYAHLTGRMRRGRVFEARAAPPAPPALPA